MCIHGWSLVHSCAGTWRCTLHLKVHTWDRSGWWPVYILYGETPLFALVGKQLLMYTTVLTASAQYCEGNWASSNMVLTMVIMVQLNHSVILLYSRVYAGAGSCMMPSAHSALWKAVDLYSPPWLEWSKHTAPWCLLAAINSWNLVMALLLACMKYTYA